MPGVIYSIQDDGQLVEMRETTYASEDLLQGYLERYEDLLPGDQMYRDDPRQWLLVRREQGVPDEEDSGSRWSLDHLFLDQDGIPTLVEVKRSQDTRIRRKVVAQMLDYAANAASYWSLETIQDDFEERCDDLNQDPEDLLRNAFDDEEIDVGEYWEDVRRNLEAEKIRMVFVADEIPGELQRIVEFLNEQLSPSEVFAVEVRQFESKDGDKALVPTVKGWTAKAEQRKTGEPKQTWTIERLTEYYRDSHEPDVTQRIEKILQLAEERDCFVGHTTKNPRFGVAGLGMDHSFVKIKRLKLLHPGINVFGDKWEGDPNQRNQWIEAINKLGFWDEDLQGYSSYLTASRTLKDLSEEEFSELYSLIERFAGE